MRDATTGPKKPREKTKLALYALSGDQCVSPGYTEAVFENDLEKVAHIHSPKTRRAAD
ncbi:MAG: hypothetical protein HY675_28075 [Chloroflexi bacterium]|nr:hypothetical protein [Chloroflexota bacterium]